jgi:hypothetical protein
VLQVRSAGFGALACIRTSLCEFQGVDVVWGGALWQGC